MEGRETVLLSSNFYSFLVDYIGTMNKICKNRQRDFLSLVSACVKYAAKTYQKKRVFEIFASLSKIWPQIFYKIVQSKH
jgi:hypothetical protein